MTKVFMGRMAATDNNSLNLAGAWCVSYGNGNTATMQLPGTMTDAGL